MNQPSTSLRVDDTSATIAAASHQGASRIFVLFTGKTELRWLAWLKPGFRHCLAVINDGQGWLLFDPLAGYLSIERLAVPAGWDLPGWYQSVGYTVLPATAHRPARQAPPGPMTCVEAIKRLLGLHKPLIITPHQLYRHLRAQQHQQAGDSAPVTPPHSK